MGQLANALGKNIRAQRKAKGLSQDALPLSCKIDRSYMGRIERGEVNLTVEKLYSIAGVLQCEPGTLLPQYPLASIDAQAGAQERLSKFFPLVLDLPVSKVAPTALIEPKLGRGPATTEH